MKRFVILLLLVGLCLPMVFDGCKKPEKDPVTPTGASSKDSTIFSTIYIGCGEADEKKGLMLLYTQQNLVAGKYQPVEILGADYLRFTYKNYTDIQATLQTAHATLTRKDPAVKKYQSPSEFWENSFKSNSGFVKRQSLTKEQATAFIDQETIQLARASVGQPSWDWTTPLEALLNTFVTSAQAQSPGTAQAESWFGHVSFESVLAIGGGVAVGLLGLEIGGVVVIVSTTALAAGFVFYGFKEVYDSLVKNPGQRAVDAYNQKMRSGSSGSNGQSLGDAIAGFFAYIFGDPHLVTLDKVKYDFQAMGEFVAMKSTTDKFEVQVRYGAQGESSVTFNKAIAINTGADVISIDLMQTYLHINKQKVSFSQINEKPYTLPGGGTLTRSSGIVRITTPNNDQIVTFTNNALFFKPAENRRGKLVGLLGNFDGNLSNDGRTRDDKEVNLLRPEELYPTYADSWRITQSESLFFYENGATTETYTDRTKPNEKRPFNSLSLTDRARAEAVCRQAGVTREPELSNCILDVAITGDASYATLASQVAKDIPTDNNFLLLADFPGKSSEGAVGLTVGDKIYAGLGRRQVDWAMYDPATDKWTTKAPFPGGKNSYGNMGTFVIGTKIYFVGGRIDGTMTNALWEYDTATDKWAQRKDVPGAARLNIASFALNGKGFALFGTIGWGNVGDFPTNSAVYEYNPTTDAWMQRADFPGKPRGNNITNTEYNGMVMLIDGRLFLGGGSGGGAPGNDWYEYIAASDAWVKKANIVIEGNQYFSVGTIGYVIRGNTLLSYNASTDTWSKFPGKEIYQPLAINTVQGIKQAPVLNGKAYIGLGYGTNNVGVKEWWSFKP